MGARVVLGEGWAELRDELGLVKDRVSRAAGIDQDGRIALVNAGGATSSAILDSLRPLGEQLGAIQNGLSQFVSPYASMSLEIQAAINRLLGPTPPEMLEVMRQVFPSRPHFPSPSLVKTAPESQGLIAPSVAELDAIQAGKPISAKQGRKGNSWSYSFFDQEIKSSLALGMPHYTIAKAIVDKWGWAHTVNDAKSRQVVYAANYEAAVDGLARWIRRDYISMH